MFRCVSLGRPGLLRLATNYCKYIRRPNCRRARFGLSAQYVDILRSLDEGRNPRRLVGALRFSGSIFDGLSVVALARINVLRCFILLCSLTNQAYFDLFANVMRLHKNCK